MNDGATAEAQFVRDAIALGYIVAVPVFRTAHFDVVVSRGTRVARVQIKSSARRTARKATHVPAYSVDLRRAPVIRAGRRGTKSKYPPGSYDVLAVWLAEDRSWLFIPKRRLSARTGLQIVPHRGTAKRLNNWDAIPV